jgi:hypothetical protein
MKQTSVEWFANQLFSSMVDGKTLNYFDVQKMLEQAKEMEKQQIIDTYNEADTFPQSYHNAENYYNETFKK